MDGLMLGALALLVSRLMITSAAPLTAAPPTEEI
jgi:hypothetical protein